jgi:hypothetical protein
MQESPAEFYADFEARIAATRAEIKADKEQLDTIYTANN